MSDVVPFPRQGRLRAEEDALLDRLQHGVNFAWHDGNVEPRATHGIVVMKGNKRLGMWVLLEGAFHYLPFSEGQSETTADVETAYQHSLAVVREAA